MKIVVRVKLISLLLLIIFILGSCATPELHMVLRERVDIRPIPGSNKIPLRAGVWVNPSLRTMKVAFVRGETFGTRGSTIQLQPGTIFLGDLLSQNIEAMLKNIFKEIAMIDPIDSPASLPGMGYDVIVKPKLLIYEQRINFAGYSSPAPCMVQITIEWDISSVAGKPIYSTTIKGEGIVDHHNKSGSRSVPETNKKAIISSVEDSMQKAQDDIYMGGWWEKQWWKES
jgi:hypothetical protein